VSDANNRDLTTSEGGGASDPPRSIWASRQPGTYLLLLHVLECATCDVGRLGILSFQPGWYVYTGSALGGLGGRLRRHARLGKPRHWHIDSLREVAQLVSLAVHVGSERIECAAAGRVGALPGAHQPIARFGASDCRCSAHLTFFSERPDLQLDPTWTVVPLDAPD
jgi:sugar fermentation stimulation protein A